MRVALVSADASPLAVPPDAGGQSLHVAELAAALGRAGHDVRVYTHRHAADLPSTVDRGRGVLVVHVPAPEPAPRANDVFPNAEGLGRWLAERWRVDDWVPHVVHAHYWTSGLAAL